MAIATVTDETVQLFYGFVLDAFSELDSYRRQIRQGIAVDTDAVRETCDGLIESLDCYQLAVGRIPTGGS